MVLLGALERTTIKITCLASKEKINKSILLSIDKDDIHNYKKIKLICS